MRWYNHCIVPIGGGGDVSKNLFFIIIIHISTKLCKYNTTNIKFQVIELKTYFFKEIILDSFQYVLLWNLTIYNLFLLIKHFSSFFVHQFYWIIQGAC